MQLKQKCFFMTDPSHCSEQNVTERMGNLVPVPGEVNGQKVPAAEPNKNGRFLHSVTAIATANVPSLKTGPLFC